MDILILLIFAVGLVACIVFKISIVAALGAGFVLFFGYTVYKGTPVRTVCRLCLKGVLTVKNVLITFVLIGMLTGIWRASGTIPSIVSYSMKLVLPSIFILLTFWLNCLVSFLTGTAFGTAATMGAVCMVMGNAMELSPVWMGGAILSGVFFGDRCSPVSTSALLVSDLTGTDIFTNIRLMFKTAWIPFGTASIVYLAAGFLTGRGSGELMDVQSLFAGEVRIGWLPLLPAALILLLSLAKIPVKKTMMVSIAAALLVCIFYQKTPGGEIVRILVTGYETKDPDLASMMNGGGILSMARVAAIVCISSSYAGMFQANGLLDTVSSRIRKLAGSWPAYHILAVIAVIMSAFACNQTLSIMLTNQLMREVVPDRQKLAIFLENSAVVIAPLIPWSIAGAVPLSSVGAPTAALLTACYLYLIPIWTWITERKSAAE